MACLSQRGWRTKSLAARRAVGESPTRPLHRHRRAHEAQSGEERRRALPARTQYPGHVRSRFDDVFDQCLANTLAAKRRGDDHHRQVPVGEPIGEGARESGDFSIDHGWLPMRAATQPPGWRDGPHRESGVPIRWPQEDRGPLRGPVRQYRGLASCLLRSSPHATTACRGCDRPLWIHPASAKQEAGQLCADASAALSVALGRITASNLAVSAR
jgi:hypothetical protein